MLAMPTLGATRVLGTLAPNGLPGARRAVQTACGRVFGPAPFKPAAAPGDPGLFGPGSVSWRVIADPASIVGGVRALLIQLLHPLAVAAMAAHSRFREDTIGRLQRTSGYVVITTFGSVPEVVAAARTVRRVHRRVVGTSPDGRQYRADDPHLLAWVSVALTASFLTTHRFYAATPLDRANSDAFVDEQSRAAALLDPRVDLDALTADRHAISALRAGRFPLPMLQDGSLPRSLDELDAALATYRPELKISDPGRQALRFLLWPSLGPLTTAGYLPALAGAVATLEPDMRRLLGIRLPPLAAFAVTTQVRTLLAMLRAAVGTSPSLNAATARVSATTTPR